MNVARATLRVHWHDSANTLQHGRPESPRAEPFSGLSSDAVPLEIWRLAHRLTAAQEFAPLRHVGLMFRNGRARKTPSAWAGSRPQACLRIQGVLPCRRIDGGFNRQRPDDRAKELACLVFLVRLPGSNPRQSRGGCRSFQRSSGGDGLHQRH